MVQTPEERQMQMLGLIPPRIDEEQNETATGRTRVPENVGPLTSEDPATSTQVAQSGDMSQSQLESLGIPVSEPEPPAPAEPSAGSGGDRLSAEQAEALGIPVSTATPEPETEPEPEPVPGDSPPPTEEQPAEFTQFTTDIYDGMPYDQAMNLYRAFLEDPNTTTGPLRLYAFQTNPDTGERTFLMPPSRGVLGNPDAANTAFSDKLVLGGVDAVGDVLELGGAITDKIGLTENATETMRNAVPEVNTGDSTLDALTAEAPAIFSASLKGAQLAYNAAKNAPRVARAISTYLGAETGATLVSDSDDQSIAIGENAMVPILRGVDLEDTEANQVIEGRLNLLADGLIAGGVVSETARVGGKVFGLAYQLTAQPLVRALRQDPAGIENETITRVLDQLGSAMEDYHRVDANGKYEIRQRITDVIEENKDVIVASLDTSDEALEFTVDTMTALNRGLPENEAGQLRSVLEGLRTGQTQQTGSATLQATNRPVRELQAGMESRIRDTGGETAAEQTQTMATAADELAEQGRREVSTAADQIARAEAALNARADDLIADLANDVELSEDIVRLGRVTGTEIDTARIGSRNEVLDRVRQGYETMRSRKNELYSAIEGGAIDVGSLYDALAGVRLDELSRQASSLRASSPLRQMAELFQPRMVPADGTSTDIALRGAAGNSSQMRQETRDEVIERVQGWFNRDPEMYNFGYFNNIIRPELSTLANDLFQRNETLSGRAVRDIVNTIDNDMVDFVRRSDPQLADAADEAKRYYQQEFAPLFRDGPLQRYSELYESTVGRDPNIGRVNFGSGSRRLVDETMAAGDPDEIGQFRTLLSRTEAGADPSPLAEYMVADSIASAADSLRASSGTDVQIGSFVNKLRQYSEALRQNFPERAAELDTFAERVQGLQGNRDALQRTLDEAKAGLTETLDRVRNGELKSFFRREFGEVENPALRDLATASDPQAAFRSLIVNRNNNTTAAMRQIADRIDNAPPESRRAIQDGLETAYMRLLRERFFGQTRESGNLRTLLSRNIKDSQEEVTSLFNVGEIVFRDKPEVFEALTTITDLAADTNLSRNARPIASMSPTEFNRQATTASNRLIYTFIGPLSRLGTRVRAGVGALLERYSPDERAARIMDNVLADPDYFVELARRYNRRPADTEARMRLTRALLAGLVRPEPSEADDDGSLVEDAARAERGLTEQTDELLGR